MSNNRSPFEWGFFATLGYYAARAAIIIGLIGLIATINLCNPS